MNIYSHEKVSFLHDKNILVVGYGSQGRSQSLNLRDSDIKNIKISLYKGSKSIETAIQDGFTVEPIESAVNWSDIIVFLAPDENHREIYNSIIKNRVKKGQTLIFAHGFSIHYKMICPLNDLNICMVSPKAVGPSVRSKYIEEQGVACLTAIKQDPSGDTKLIMNSYAAAISLGKVLISTTFSEETESNLFSEQVVLCGGIPYLIKSAFDVLVNSGFSPEVAYWGCLHEVKLIADLIYTDGLAGMYNMISNTAEYGAYITGRKIIDESVKNKMINVLGYIRSSKFTQDFLREKELNFSNLKNKRNKLKESQIETVGHKLRKMSEK